MFATVTIGNAYSSRDSFPILVYLVPFLNRKIILTNVNNKTLLIIVIGIWAVGSVTIIVRFSPKTAENKTIVINSETMDNVDATAERKILINHFPLKNIYAKRKVNVKTVNTFQREFWNVLIKVNVIAQVITAVILLIKIVNDFSHLSFK